MADRYSSFKTLAAAERRGEDYDFRAVDRGKAVVLVAPHGGFIEPGTSEIAEAIAGDDLSLYVFEGLRPKRPHGDLHITSHLFDEPEGLKLVSGCVTALAIHGRADRGDPDRSWLGGRNVQLKELVSAALNKERFPSIDAPAGLAAQSVKNICNRGTMNAGVQIELPRSLRARLIDEPELLGRFAIAVRNALLCATDL